MEVCFFGGIKRLYLNNLLKFHTTVVILVRLRYCRSFSYLRGLKWHILANAHARVARSIKLLIDFLGNVQEECRREGTISTPAFVIAQPEFHAS